MSESANLEEDFFEKPGKSVEQSIYVSWKWVDFLTNSYLLLSDYILQQLDQIIIDFSLEDNNVDTLDDFILYVYHNVENEDFTKKFTVDMSLFFLYYFLEHWYNDQAKVIFGNIDPSKIGKDRLKFYCLTILSFKFVEDVEIYLQWYFDMYWVDVELLDYYAEYNSYFPKELSWCFYLWVNLDWKNKVVEMDKLIDLLTFYQRLFEAWKITDPEWYKIYNVIWDYYFENIEFETAEKFYQKLIEFWDKDAYIKLWQLYFALNDFDKARKYLEEWFYNHKNYDCLWLLIDLYRELNIDSWKYDKNIDEFVKTMVSSKTKWYQYYQYLIFRDNLDLDSVDEKSFEFLHKLFRAAVNSWEYRVDDEDAVLISYYETYYNSALKSNDEVMQLRYLRILAKIFRSRNYQIIYFEKLSLFIRNIDKKSYNVLSSFLQEYLSIHLVEECDIIKEEYLHEVEELLSWISTDLSENDFSNIKEAFSYILHMETIWVEKYMIRKLFNDDALPFIWICKSYCWEIWWALFYKDLSFDNWKPIVSKALCGRSLNQKQMVDDIVAESEIPCFIPAINSLRFWVNEISGTLVLSQPKLTITGDYVLDYLNEYKSYILDTFTREHKDIDLLKFDINVLLDVKDEYDEDSFLYFLNIYVCSCLTYSWVDWENIIKILKDNWLYEKLTFESLKFIATRFIYSEDSNFDLSLLILSDILERFSIDLVICNLLYFLHKKLLAWDIKNTLLIDIISLSNVKVILAGFLDAFQKWELTWNFVLNSAIYDLLWVFLFEKNFIEQSENYFLSAIHNWYYRSFINLWNLYLKTSKVDNYIKAMEMWVKEWLYECAISLSNYYFSQWDLVNQEKYLIIATKLWLSDWDIKLFGFYKTNARLLESNKNDEKYIEYINKWRIQLMKIISRNKYVFIEWEDDMFISDLKDSFIDAMDEKDDLKLTLEILHQIVFNYRVISYQLEYLSFIKDFVMMYIWKETDNLEFKEFEKYIHKTFSWSDDILDFIVELRNKFVWWFNENPAYVDLNAFYLFAEIFKLLWNISLYNSFMESFHELLWKISTEKLFNNDRLEQAKWKFIHYWVNQRFDN